VTGQLAAAAQQRAAQRSAAQRSAAQRSAAQRAGRSGAWCSRGFQLPVGPLAQQAAFPVSQGEKGTDRRFGGLQNSVAAAVVYSTQSPSSLERQRSAQAEAAVAAAVAAVLAAGVT
jgi:hypothetical protein